MSDVERCAMWLDLSGRRICGKPASLGWKTSSETLVAICEDCINDIGHDRQFLSPLTENPISGAGAENNG